MSPFFEWNITHAERFVIIVRKKIDLLWPITRCISHWSLVDTLVYHSFNIWEAASLITFVLKESLCQMLPSAIFSNSYFHCGSPQSARMSPPEAHTLLGTLPVTYEPLFGRGVQKPTPVNQVPSLCQTQYFWVLCTHTVSFPSHKNSLLLILQRKELKDWITQPKVTWPALKSGDRIWIPFFLKPKSSAFLPNTKRPSIGRKWYSWPHLFFTDISVYISRNLLQAWHWSLHCWPQPNKGSRWGLASVQRCVPCPSRWHDFHHHQQRLGWA